MIPIESFFLLTAGTLAGTAAFILRRLINGHPGTTRAWKRFNGIPEPKTTPYMAELSIPATGQPQFTPRLSEELYRITVRGTYQFRRPDGSVGYADAAYFRPSNDASLQPYKGLRIARASIRTFGWWEEDRDIHEYACVIEGTHQILPITLHPPTGDGQGSLALAIELLPFNVAYRMRSEKNQRKIDAVENARELENRVLRQQSELAIARSREDAATREQERRQNEARKREADLRRRISEISAKVHLHSNFLNQKFREQFVRSNRQEVLGSLGKSWREEYAVLMADQAWVDVLRRQAPQVLDWYERRLEMVLLAEQLEVTPQEPPAEIHRRKITARTIDTVENVISQLFALRDDSDRLREELARSGTYDSAKQRDIDGALRVMAHHFNVLKSFGVVADTPEQAEAKFLKLWPRQPAKTYYEELSDRIKSGEILSPDAVRNPLEDLHREETILRARRRHAIRNGSDALRRDLDERLATVRREAISLRNLLVSIGASVEFPEYREQEETREIRFFKIMQERRNIISALKAEGDDDVVEHVEALYNEEQAKLFGSNDQTYA